MIEFLAPLEPDQLERQIFDLMYTQMGSGLGMSYTEVMALDVSRKDRLLKMLFEQLEKEAAAMKAKPGSST